MLIFNLTMDICLSSKMNLNVFPKNHAFKFSVWIEDDKLTFDETNQEVAVKQIFIDNCVLKECDEGDVLAIKSNICCNSLISTSENSLLCIFTLEKIRNQYHETLALSFQNPIYFTTFKTYLLNSEFEVWNLDKNKLINIEAILPSFIVISIKNRIIFDEKMNKKLLYIDSNDFHSMQCFSNNNNSSFTIQLPHDLSFKNKASACLRSIFIPNAIKKIKEFQVSLYFTNLDEKFIHINEDTEFENQRDLINYLNTIFVKEGLICDMRDDKVTIFKSSRSKVSKIMFSPNLRKTLGFRSEILIFQKVGKRVAHDKFNFTYCQVSFLIVEIDIIEKTIFGENDVGILKILPLKVNEGMVSSYYFSENEKKKLRIRNFSQLTIKIFTDGLELVQFSSSDIGTKLMLEIEDY